jgi:hypothetical protein
MTRLARLWAGIRPTRRARRGLAAAAITIASLVTLAGIAPAGAIAVTDHGPVTVSVVGSDGGMISTTAPPAPTLRVYGTAGPIEADR